MNAYFLKIWHSISIFISKILKVYSTFRVILAE